MKKSENDVIAENLRRLMGQRGMVQTQVAEKSGVGQTTVSNYLNPGNRKPGAKGKVPSAKVSELEMIAAALGVECWELMRPMDSARAQALDGLEKALDALSAISAQKLPSGNKRAA